jgi:excisionase family DNA binding protein
MSLISVDQAAGMLGVSRSTAYRMVREHLIPTVRMLKRGVRVHAEKLQQMIDAEAAASILAAGGMSEETECLTREPIRLTGGSLSRNQMEKEFADLLAQATTPRRKR